LSKEIAQIPSLGKTKSKHTSGTKKILFNDFVNYYDGWKARDVWESIVVSMSSRHISE
jgi:hypothetical protein